MGQCRSGWIGWGASDRTTALTWCSHAEQLQGMNLTCSTIYQRVLGWSIGRSRSSGTHAQGPRAVYPSLPACLPIQSKMTNLFGHKVHNLNCSPHPLVRSCAITLQQVHSIENNREAAPPAIVPADTRNTRRLRGCVGGAVS